MQVHLLHMQHGFGETIYLLPGDSTLLMFNNFRNRQLKVIKTLLNIKDIFSAFIILTHRINIKKFNFFSGPISFT